ncbi:MAG: DUF2752 domain-containing protein [Microscillaceae bacterium]|jgi:hypothetical protein|nr:DUF2752 domain-containing protein [Microscillaceae bacterium]
MNWRFYFSIVKIAFYVLVPIVLLALPVDFFDSGETVCLSVTLFNTECYGCGMTSAMMHLIHLDPETAYAYNMLSLLAFPILAYLWARWAVLEVFALRKMWLAHQTKISA